MIPKYAKAYLDEITGIGYKPKNPREGRFLADVKYLIEKDRMLSGKQEKWLISIYEKATGGGQYQQKQYFGG